MNDHNVQGRDMSQFDLGALLSRLETKVDSLNDALKETIQHFRAGHDDHEMRLRKMESNYATKDDVKKVHARVDKLNTTVWKIMVYLAAGGTTGVLGAKVLGIL